MRESESALWHEVDLRDLYEDSTGTSSESNAVFYAPVPEGWDVRMESPWTHLDRKAQDLPDQGWKVHVSAVENTAHQTLAIVTRIAVAHGVSFKHLVALRQFRIANAKYTSRESAGKFIALYPHNEDALEGLVAELCEALQGLPGPYILSDVRCHTSSPVFVRYGAFRGVWRLNEGDEIESCITDSSGRLIGDRREPQFYVPDFVDIPDFLHEAVDERLNPTDTALAELLEGFKFIQPLHFSNGGGVYELESTSDGRRFIAKEGRANAGWDYRGIDAFDRIASEYANLVALAPTDLVPKPHSLRTIGEHAFLFESFIEGQDLHSWVAQNYPYSYKFGVADYEQKALEILRRLEEGVNAIHAAGFAVMDLQPANVIVTSGNEVRFIDLESVCSLEANNAASYIGTPGFVPKGEHTPVERDKYALAQLAIGIFYPLTSLNAISDSVVQTTVRRIDELFSPAVGEHMRRLVAESKPALDFRGLAGAAVFPKTQEESRRCNSALIVNGVHRVRSSGSGGSDSTSPYPFLRGMPEIDAVSIERGLAGLMLALGPHDVNADEDLEHIVRQTSNLQVPRPGLLSGVLGVCGLVASRGAPSEARAILHRQMKFSCSSSNVSIRSGLAGELLGLMWLQQYMADDKLNAKFEETLSALLRVIEQPPQQLVSPHRLAANPLGLIDGWSGVSFALSVAASFLGDPSLYDYARRAVELDMPNTVVAPDGSRQADDGFRMMPYLADGSGGMGIALSMIPVRYRAAGDDQTLQDIALACRARVSISGGLLHGRVGLLLALAAIDVEDLDGTSIEDILREQLVLMEPFLFTGLNSQEVFMADESNRRLGLDFRSGSAGALFVFRLLEGTAGLAESSEIVRRVSERGRRALGLVSSTLKDPPFDHNREGR